MQAYQSAFGRRIIASLFLQEVRQSTQAPPATENQAIVSRQRFAPLTQETLIRAIKKMAPRQFERWQMAAELAVLRVSLACAPQEHQYNQDVMKGSSSRNALRAARPPGRSWPWRGCSSPWGLHCRRRKRRPGSSVSCWRPWPCHPC